MTVIILLKLTLTPLLLVGTTLAARRWGSLVGGWIVGLPLTSGPVSVFLAVEQGREFAAAAAHSTFNGLFTSLVFCLVYERCARRFTWPVAVFVSLSAFFSFVAFFSVFSPPLWASVALVAGEISLGLLLVPAVSGKAIVTAAPSWDLPFRVVAATGIVVVVTTVSRGLGPQLSGLLSTFPIFLCVMSVFSHSLNGPIAVHNFTRGVIAGSYAFLTFFLVVELGIRSWNLAVVYVTAILGAFFTNYVVYQVMAAFRRR